MSLNAKRLGEKYDAVIGHLRQMPRSRARDLAIQHLEESALWAACAVEHIDSPVDFVAFSGTEDD